jgi:regulator of replication initiation timing
MSEHRRTLSQQADEIRNELDSLIGDNESLEGIEVDPRLPQVPQQVFNFRQTKDNADKQAKKTIDSLMRFYLDADIIEQDEYVKAKKKMDEMTMSSLVFQLQAGERALTRLLETIEDGDLAPRMFEVLATLQKSMLDIIKSQTMYLMATEESVKRIARDAEIYQQKTNKRIAQEASEDGINEGGNVQRGTKDLMAKIQAGIKAAENEIEDAQVEDNSEE